jgi:hypothetical protein
MVLSSWCLALGHIFDRKGPRSSVGVNEGSTLTFSGKVITYRIHLAANFGLPRRLAPKLPLKWTNGGAGWAMPPRKEPSHTTRINNKILSCYGPASVT